MQLFHWSPHPISALYGLLCRSAAHILGAVTDIIIIAHRADHLPPTFLEARYLMIYEIKDNVPSPDICNRVFGVALWLVQIDFCPEMNEWDQLLLVGCCSLFVQKSNYDLGDIFQFLFSTINNTNWKSCKNYSRWWLISKEFDIYKDFSKQEFLSLLVWKFRKGKRRKN